VAERTIRALVAIEDLDSLDVQRALPDDASFNLVGLAHGHDELVRAMHNLEYDVVLVACTGQGERALQLIDVAHRNEPEVPVLVLSTTSPNGFLRRAFEAGAVDVTRFPQPKEDLRFAMHKALARRRRFESARGSDDVRLVVVLGPKGGTGKTLAACNTAVALAGLGEKVLVVDLDLQFGDVALTMGLRPDKTIYDLAVSGGSLDEDKLADYVTSHSSGVDVLLAPSRPDQASAITIDLLRNVYQVARHGYDAIIVDTPPGFTAEVIATIDSATDLVMVGMLDSLSLKNTKLGLETLDLMEFRNDRIKLVLNRAHSRVGITQSDVVAVLGRDPDVLVPSDREIPRAVNEGVPIVQARPQSVPAEAFRELALMFASPSVLAGVASAGETAVATQSGSRRRLFGRK
jgi:pilus assembly protein CpaE